MLRCLTSTCDDLSMRMKNSEFNDKVHWFQDFKSENPQSCWRLPVKMCITIIFEGITPTPVKLLVCMSERMTETEIMSETWVWSWGRVIITHSSLCNNNYLVLMLIAAQWPDNTNLENYEEFLVNETSGCKLHFCSTSDFSSDWFLQFRGQRPVRGGWLDAVTRHSDQFPSLQSFN